MIRTVLVPASMVLLGRWNWYLPSWLEWLPELHVEGGAEGEVEREVDAHSTARGHFVMLTCPGGPGRLPSEASACHLEVAP